MTDDAGAMRELRRVVTLTGRGLVLVPIPLDVGTIDETIVPLPSAEHWARFAQDDHVRLYTHNGLIERLEAVGLHVSLFDRRSIGSRALQRFGLTETSTLYFVEPTRETG